MKKTILLSLFLSIIIAGKAQSNIEATTSTGQKVILHTNNTWEYKSSIAQKPIITNAHVTGLMKQNGPPKEGVIAHKEYTLAYNSTYRLASSVSYELTKEMLLTQPRMERSDKFTRDPGVKADVSAMDGDYKKSGYDRGHLCPAADMSHSEKAMEETFYYSNMSPQKPGFNRGIWKKLEEQVRTWAIENSEVYVVTGPVLGSNYVTKENDLFVPKYFYKVILDYSDPGVKGIGFILPNESSSADLSSFAVSIDSVEKFTGIDFFPSLPDDQEKVIESSCEFNRWSVPTISTVNAKSGNYTTTSSSETVNKKDTVAATGQCTATTQAGNQCKRTAEAGSDYCWQHKGKTETKASPTTEKTITATPSSYGGSQEIHTGPRGGQYYINSHGNKTYVKRK